MMHSCIMHSGIVDSRILFLPFSAIHTIHANTNFSPVILVAVSYSVAGMLIEKNFKVSPSLIYALALAIVVTVCCCVAVMV